MGNLLWDYSLCFLLYCLLQSLKPTRKLRVSSNWENSEPTQRSPLSLEIAQPRKNKCYSHSLAQHILRACREVCYSEKQHLFEKWYLSPQCLFRNYLLRGTVLVHGCPDLMANYVCFRPNFIQDSTSSYQDKPSSTMFAGLWSRSKSALRSLRKETHSRTILPMFRNLSR